MEEVRVGIIGLGNVGSGTLAILAENADQIALKLGFRLKVSAVCSRSVASKTIPDSLGAVFKTPDWRALIERADVDIVAELVGGTTTAAEIIDAAIAHKKSVVTANKELMSLCGPEIWDRAIPAGINVAMEASVAGGIPIHAVLREGISGDRVVAISGILNGTSNFILTEMEKRGDTLETVLAEAQRLGYAEADPSADVDGFDARSKLSILAALAFGEKILPSDIYVEGIRRISPMDFQYAHQLGHTIRLICGAQQTPQGLILSVRPALIRSSTILAGVQGAYNAVWVKGAVRPGYVLLRPRRRLPSDRSRRGQRPDARRARNPRGKSRARFALRARAAGRIPARVGDAAKARLLPAIPRRRPPRNHRRAGRHPGRPEHRTRRRPAGAVRDQTRPALRHHRRADHRAIDPGSRSKDVLARFSARAPAGPSDGTAVIR